MDINNDFYYIGNSKCNIKCLITAKYRLCFKKKFVRLIFREIMMFGDGDIRQAMTQGLPSADKYLLTCDMLQLSPALYTHILKLLQRTDCIYFSVA